VSWELSDYDEALRCALALLGLSRQVSHARAGLGARVCATALLTVARDTAKFVT